MLKKSNNIEWGKNSSVWSGVIWTKSQSGREKEWTQEDMNDTQDGTHRGKRRQLSPLPQGFSSHMQDKL